MRETGRDTETETEPEAQRQTDTQRHRKRYIFMLKFDGIQTVIFPIVKTFLGNVFLLPQLRQEDKIGCIIK